MIDYRSDTVTRPTEGMRAAMMAAPVGDDVFQDDPTVNALEAKAAVMFGMEAALFAPSGTMTNQIAIKVHTNPGDEVVCDKLSHIYNYEGGGIASNSGCSVRLLDGDKGRFTHQMVLDSILPDDSHFPVTRLVSVENTSNKGGGVIWDDAEIELISRTCKKHGLGFHMDGARLFNALVETKQRTEYIGSMFDSISICLSKGLGCPVGSLLLGSKDFIRQAHRVRKVFGGGMRQVGILAGAGIYALDHHIDRLKEDHINARQLALALSEAEWVKHVVPVETNIIVVELADGENQQARLDELRAAGVLAMGFGPGKLRFVTHLDVTEAMIDQTISVINAMK
ncbi:MAG: threonine aldolase [Flavobacteriales bacterium]|nr:threonine aldolase [Flavobacteriales bacterium]